MSGGGSAARIDHLAPIQKVQSFATVLCVCIGFALITFVCVFVQSERFVSLLCISIVSAPPQTHSPAAAAAAAACICKLFVSCIFYTVFFCSRTFRHVISGQSNCRICLLQFYNWNIYTTTDLMTNYYYFLITALHSDFILFKTICVCLAFFYSMLAIVKHVQ